MNQADLIDINRMLYPKSTEYTFFSASHCTYSKIDHIIGNKSLLSKCKRTEIITNSLSDEQSIRPQRNQTRTQDQETHSNPHNHLESEQPASEC